MDALSVEDRDPSTRATLAQDDTEEDAGFGKVLFFCHPERRLPESRDPGAFSGALRMKKEAKVQTHETL
ncbi:MAG TPA: hypothetical protein VGI29_00745 [Candidatus Binataceae bacterium]|jgi:hypothetical protein